VVGVGQLAGLVVAVVAGAVGADELRDAIEFVLGELLDLFVAIDAPRQSSGGIIVVRPRVVQFVRLHIRKTRPYAVSEFLQNKSRPFFESLLESYLHILSMRFQSIGASDTGSPANAASFRACCNTTTSTSNPCSIWRNAK
jgi:hypothetical protein